jgi:predicted DNA-binding protein
MPRDGDEFVTESDLERRLKDLEKRLGYVESYCFENAIEYRLHQVEGRLAAIVSRLDTVDDYLSQGVEAARNYVPDPKESEDGEGVAEPEAGSSPLPWRELIRQTFPFTGVAPHVIYLIETDLLSQTDFMEEFNLIEGERS